MNPCDEAVFADQNSISSHVTLSDIEANERPRSLRSTEPLHDGAGQVNSTTIWAKLKNYLIRLYTSLQHRYWESHALAGLG